MTKSRKQLIPNVEESEALARMRKLTDELQRHDDLYYNDGSPAITDAEYDALKRELAELESLHPGAAAADSPTKRVGAPLAARALAQAEHRVPMLSLDSLTSEDEVRDFAARACKGLGLDEGGDAELTWSLEPKYDGVSANLLYEARRFTLGLSRGDGRVGEVSTENFARVRGIPVQLEGRTPPRLIEVRGEILLTRQRFRELQQEQERNDQQVFRYARNAVAGALKRNDARGLEDLGMDFIAWGVGAYEGSDEIGEIAIRGHNIMKGYLNRPEATAEVMRDGWFRSGDLARRDEDGF
nr:AMP-binding protein [Planctomycetota bacterium]